MDKLSDRKDFAPIRQWSDTDERWLISRFPFLSADCLKVAIELETDLSWARDKNPLKQTHEQMWSQMTALRERFLTAARRQLNELFLLAGAQHPQSPTARRILWLMLLFPGKQPEELVETCQSGAAGTMAGVTEWPPEQLNENLSCVCTALTRRMQLSEEMRLRLLETFMHLAVRDTTINSRLSGEKIGAILTEAFLLELSRPESKQSLEYGSELLCQMKDYRYPAAAEVLQVVVESHWSPALRDLAGQVLDSLKDSLQCQWDATVFDDKATADMRVESLALAVRERDAKRLLKAIFSNLKGCRFTGATDRRMRIINKLFAHPNDLIRLATCFALVKSNDYNDSIETLVPAIALLADLAVNSRTPSVMADAVTLIEWLKQQHSHSRDQIAQACATANAKFIKVQMQALERVH